jgi:ABC-2 type transport system permease protein
MAVYKRTYKAYRGPLTPAWSRFAVLTRYGLSTLFESRFFTAYTVLCLMPFLACVIFLYVLSNTSVQALLQQRLQFEVDNMFFLGFLGVEAWMSFLLTAWGAPGMISKDFANHSIQLYLSRPLSRAEYLLGKISVMAALLSCTTWIPALILFLLQASLKGHGWGWDHLWIAKAIVVAAFLGIAIVSLLSMALAVWVRWRIAATALMFGTFFMLPAFGEIFNAVMRTQWGKLINITYVMMAVWADLFRVPRAPHGPHFDQIPLWASWASLLAMCAICLWLLNRRLKAREVERA